MHVKYHFYVIAIAMITGALQLLVCEDLKRKIDTFIHLL